MNIQCIFEYNFCVEICAKFKAIGSYIDIGHLAQNFKQSGRLGWDCLAVRLWLFWRVQPHHLWQQQRVGAAGGGIDARERRPCPPPLAAGGSPRAAASVSQSGGAELTCWVSRTVMPPSQRLACRRSWRTFVAFCSLSLSRVGRARIDARVLPRNSVISNATQFCAGDTFSLSTSAPAAHSHR